MSNNVEDYLERGMYGAKEINPAERRKFLGTIRERIVIALTKEQVKERGTYKQVEDAIAENQEAHLYLNGHILYGDFSKYVKIASKYDVTFTIVTNKDHDSEIGLVLAYDYAIDKEEIYVEKEIPIANPSKSKEKGLASILEKFFWKS